MRGTLRGSINFTTWLAAIAVIQEWFWVAVVFAGLWFLEIVVEAVKEQRA